MWQSFDRIASRPTNKIAIAHLSYHYQNTFGWELFTLSAAGFSATTLRNIKTKKGRQWKRNFSIFDESDAQTLVKQIVTKTLNLDDKRFDPRKVRYIISNAKNKGWSPQEYQLAEPDYKGRVIADVYSRYQDALAANNALDFDDLILVPVQLLRQNEQLLNYWHKKISSYFS
jgi:Superfamily I DNA and RNA helicases